MARVRTAIEIHAPASVVWDITQDPTRRPEWDFRIKRAEFIDALFPKKGAKMQSSGFLLGPFQLLMEYVTVEKNKRSAVKLLQSKGLPFIKGGGSWHYEELDENSCRFHSNIQMLTKPTKRGKWMDQYVLEPFLYWMTRKSLSNLKRLAENESRRVE